MKLSELKTGETGIIVKVSGHGGFRKRIIEMGFINGKEVKVLLNAPLQDPVKYRIMGYEVSLRHSEADLIEVMAVDAEPNTRKGNTQYNPAIEVDQADPYEPALTPDEAVAAANRQRRTINVALVGNPNCGKTSLFNFASGAHERVGNYSGVTVDAKYGYTDMLGYHFELVDLPGTYSLSAYSPEELYVRKQIVEKTPDIVINVIDTSNLERNLYLTTQLIDMHVPMVCALNMYDEVKNRGDHIDFKQLSTLFGVPMVPTVFKSGRGVEDLFRTVIQNYEGKEGDKPLYRHIHINHGHELENGIAEIQEHLKHELDIRQKYSTRYLAIKLLENDSETEKLVATFPDAKKIMAHRDETAKRVKEETGEDSETAIMDAKYGFIHGALQEAKYTTGKGKDAYSITHTVDNVLTHKYLGFPLFFLFLFIMFTATFTLGQYPMDWIDAGVAWLSDAVSGLLPDGPVKAMIVDGAIAGVGAVIVFLPQILILYFLYGGLRLYGARRLHHGQAHAQDGAARQVVHSAHYGFRLQRSCGYGNKNHREQTQPTGYDAGASDDELFGTTTYLYNDDRLVLRRQIPLGGYDVALSHRYCNGSAVGAPLFKNHRERRGHTFRNGTAALSLPNVEGNRPPYVGKRQAISEEDGRNHSRCIYHRVGIGLLPLTRRPQYGQTSTAGTKLYRQNW